LIELLVVIFVNAFQQAGTFEPVNFYRRANRGVAQLVRFLK